jgi:hypothetical protein
MSKQKYKIIGTAFKHCQYSNNPMPPTSFSENIEWDWDVSSDEDIVFYVDDAIKQVDIAGHKTKIAYMIEPYVKKPNLYKWLGSNHDKFDHVLMNDKESMESIPNSIFHPFGGCWVESENRKKHDKTKLISIVASAKKQVPDHFKRHEIISKHQNIIDVYGRGYTQIESITTGLKDYMFHIAMENQRRDHHFSEKIINPMMTWTVPVYFGMPSIGDYFDTRGMLIFNSVAEFDELVPTLNKQLYESMIPYIEENFKRAQNYILSEDWLFKNNFFNTLK